jgi:hypothetical protein
MTSIDAFYANQNTLSSFSMDGEAERPRLAGSTGVLGVMMMP